MRIGQKPPSGAVAFAAAAVSTLPQMRPWKYFNEFVGGTTNAYKSFNDEGVNLGQRSKELAEYYKQELKSKGLRAYVRLSPNAVAHTPKSLSMQSFWFVLRWASFSAILSSIILGPFLQRGFNESASFSLAGPLFLPPVSRECEPS